MSKKYKTEDEQRAALVEIEKLLADESLFGLDGQARDQAASNRRAALITASALGIPELAGGGGFMSVDDKAKLDLKTGWISSRKDCE